jgi:hypothetical protein
VTPEQKTDPTFSANDRSIWERRLAGEKIVDAVDQVNYGFYAEYNRRTETFDPLAFWYAWGVRENGPPCWHLRCRVGTKEVDEKDARDKYPHARDNPITHELYAAAVKALKEGRRPEWPRLSAAVEQSRSNLAPDDNSLKGLTDAIEDLKREAERLIKKGGAKSEEESDQAADVANRLATLQKRAEAARVAEKAPHLNACNEVDAKWKGPITAAEIFKRLKQIVCRPWLEAEAARKAKLEQEAREKAAEEARIAAAAAEEAQRKQDEAAQLAAQAAQGDADAEALAEAAAEAANEAAEAAAAKEREAKQAQHVATDIAQTSVTAGTRGRGVHLRMETVVTIEDRDAVLTFFKQRSEITDLLLDMAKKAVKAGITVPGVKVEKESKAA